MARHVINVLHLLDADQLGRREFVYRGLSAREKIPVANLRRHEAPLYVVSSCEAQSKVARMWWEGFMKMEQAFSGRGGVGGGVQAGEAERAAGRVKAPSR